MSNSIFKPLLSDSDVNYENLPFNPQVLDEVRLALSHMIGQNKVTGKFHFLNVDENGNLQISIDSGGGSSIVASHVSVATTATQLLITATTRKKAILQNVGSSNIFIGGDNTVTTGDGYALTPNSILNLDGYVGQLWAIVSVGTVDLHKMEIS